MNHPSPTQPHTESAQSDRCPITDYIETNPVGAFIQALAIGFAIGILIRLIEGPRRKPAAIDVHHRPTLDEAKFHLGSLLLPFLWPAWQKARETYGHSSLRGAFGHTHPSDLPAKARAGLHEAEAWAASRAAHLASSGKQQAQAVEHWLEKEILPAAESGWKRIRKNFRETNGK